MVTQRERYIILVATIVLGLASVVVLSRRLEAHRPAVAARGEEESLYINGKTAKRLSLGFSGLLADWYWMRSLQYVGTKVLSAPRDVPLDDLSSLNLKLLAPLLDNATTLDPQFMEPYEYAAVVLPAVDVNEAIRITQKGIDANPSAWRLYQHLGYIYWQQHDYKAASKTYGAGAAIPGVPAWMQVMKARMEAEGSSRSTAREIYHRMYDEAGDEKVKEMAQRRLLQLDSFDQRDVIRKVLSLYSSKMGHCPSSWRDVAAAWRTLRFPVDSEGAPLDPSGTPYLLVKDGCEVELGAKSEVPIR